MLLGPLRALDYFFSHGLLAVVLGAIWHLKSHWSISLAVGAATRLVGLLGYFHITAWILKEDLFSLMLSNVYALLVQQTSRLFTFALIAWYHLAISCSTCVMSQPGALLLSRSAALVFGLL